MIRSPLPRNAVCIGVALFAATTASHAQGFSSSAAPAPNAPAPHAALAQAEYGASASTRPFSALGVAVKVGSGGIGFDVATPLNSRLNIRGGASFFSASPQIDTDGLLVNGGLKLQTVALSLDYFPFRGGFHISPGVTLYNNTHISAQADVPGGQNVDFGDATYTSDPSDPIHGTADLQFGNKVAPRLTVGWGNIVPRSRKHFSFPFEIGFQYTADPVVTLNLQGTACGPDGCQQINQDPMTQANIRQEQQELTSDIAPLRFFPIISFGVSYKFGH